MSHVRQQLREYVEGQLGAIADVLLEVGRVHGLPPEALPFINVATLDETSEADTLALGTVQVLQRRLSLRVELHVAAGGTTDNVPNLMDDLCVQVEQVLGPGAWNGLINPSASLVSTEIALTGEGDTRTAAAILTYDVRYRTAEDNSEVAI